MIAGKIMLVVSAHGADFVWRSGGVIAKYIQNDVEIHVIVLNLGLRGESRKLWKEPGASTESVAARRLEEVERAASILGVRDLEFWDLMDCSLGVFADRSRPESYDPASPLSTPPILTHDRNGRYSELRCKVGKGVEAVVS